MSLAHKKTSDSVSYSLFLYSAIMDWDNDDDVELQRALALSLQQQQQHHQQHHQLLQQVDSMPVPARNDNNDINVDTLHDEELAKALAMSLEQSDSSATLTVSHSSSPDGQDCDASHHHHHHHVDHQGYHQEPMSTRGTPASTSSPTTSSSPPPAPSSSSHPTIPPVNPSSLSIPILNWFQTASPVNIRPLHDVLWDPVCTVASDQRRWLAQSMVFRSTTTTETSTTATTPSTYSSTTISSRSYTVLNHANLWGLVQAHGGPCGVLASIQAELLRVLLFGPIRSTTNDPMEIPIPIPMDIPVGTNSNTTSTDNNNNRSFFPSESMPACLAISLGIILARAACQPTASSSEDHPTTTSAPAPAPAITTSTAINTTTTTTTTMPSVQLIFPKPGAMSATTTTNDDNNNNDNDLITTQVEWHHLAPWHNKKTTTSTAGTATENKYLVSYTISIGSTNINHHHQQQQFTEDHHRHEDDEITLAHSVATFLVETKLWQWYTRPGGVLLFVMALIHSRTPSKIQSDMDDANAKLTSQFGHCSQELLNLLLTGQAVSNVFDHTLRPSGDWICRGIQKRPAIGYLTLLESMRYLQVGSFYKRPIFPIWVIGSTSHFTVLFGDDTACLHESKSDQILEAVRRAFQQMDGAEEQGFIKLDQLKDFLQKLDLYEKMGDSGVSTLGASMEVHGAGILLWEDVWKCTSRLLTGASLQAVLDSDPIVHIGNSANPNGPTTQVVPVPPSDISSSVFPTTLKDVSPQSDEEYARQLQAEWDSQTVPGQRQPLAIQPPPPPPPLQHHDQQQLLRKESYGKTFRLYHYNGLRGGGGKTMHPFCVTPLSSQEAIGASVPLLRVSRPDSLLMDSPGGGLQDILRTKWPSCQIDWISGPPPSID